MTISKRIVAFMLGVILAVSMVSVLALFARPSTAAEPPRVTHFTAIVFFNAITDRAPQVIGYHTSAEGCHATVLRLNRQDERLRDPGARALGAEYACLKLERGSV